MNSMINVFAPTKIYVYCPAGIVTGGAELLHQLVDMLNRNGRKAYIVYYGSAVHKVPSDYASYKISLAEEAEDKPENILVVFEGKFDLPGKYEHIQKMLWWLSVDHFYMSSTNFLNPMDIIRWDFTLGFKTIVLRTLKLLRGENLFKNNISLKKLRDMNALHAYQSEYAQHFLLNHKFQTLCPLKDYINIEHCSFQESPYRENIVLYNPKKGVQYTKQLIAMTPEIKWIPVQNMTRAELVTLMRKSKLYIDFGYHPGKDRLPREAAMNGCCVITGMDGSAGYFEDVAIESNYKFDRKSVSKNRIVSQIEYIISNYDICILDFNYYRRSILSEKDEFDRQVRFLFSI